MTPIIIHHRRNRIDQLKDMPRGCWVEIDIDIQDDVPCIRHDSGQPAERLDAYLPRALEHGVAGFIFDCKREHVEKAVRPLLAAHEIVNYFYLNEMETVADKFLGTFGDHRTAIRIWQYRCAAEVIRYVEDMQAAKQNFPGWVWVDCWQRGLFEDIGKAIVPLDQAEAQRLQRIGVKLCVCSPELYSYDYEKTYAPEELQAIYRGVVRYRQLLIQAGITIDAVCTKLSELWTKEVDLLLKAKDFPSPPAGEDSFS